MDSKLYKPFISNTFEKEAFQILDIIEDIFKRESLFLQLEWYLAKGQHTDETDLGRVLINQKQDYNNYVVMFRQTFSKEELKISTFLLNHINYYINDYKLITFSFTSNYNENFKLIFNQESQASFKQRFLRTSIKDTNNSSQIII